MQTIKDMIDFAASHDVNTDKAIYTMGNYVRFIIYDGRYLTLDETPVDIEDDTIIEQVNGLTIKELLDWCTAHNIKYADTMLMAMGAGIKVYGITPSGLIIDEAYDDNEVVKWYDINTGEQINN